MIVTSPVIYYELHGIVKFGQIGDIDGSDALGFLVPTNLVRLGPEGISLPHPQRPTSAERR